MAGALLTTDFLSTMIIPFERLGLCEDDFKWIADSCNPLALGCIPEGMMSFIGRYKFSATLSLEIGLSVGHWGALSQNRGIHSKALDL
jgi:hypothetical protein